MPRHGLLEQERPATVVGPAADVERCGCLEPLAAHAVLAGRAVDGQDHPGAVGGRAGIAGRIALHRLRPDHLDLALGVVEGRARSEEHTSDLQSLMRISYAVFCLKKKNKQTTT